MKKTSGLNNIELPEQPEFVGKLENELGIEIKYIRIGPNRELGVFTPYEENTKTLLYFVESNISTAFGDPSSKITYLITGVPTASPLTIINKPLYEVDYSEYLRMIEKMPSEEQGSLILLGTDNKDILKKVMGAHIDDYIKKNKDWIIEECRKDMLNSFN